MRFSKLTFSALLLGFCVLAQAQVAGVYHSGWGYTDKSGNLSGRAMLGQTPIADCVVTVMQNGAIVGTASSDKEGKFTVAGVLSGVHQLRCDSASSSAAFSMLVRSVEAPQPLHVHCTSLPSEQLEQLVAQNWTPNTWGGTQKTAFGRLEEYMDSRQQSQADVITIQKGTLVGQLAFAVPTDPTSHKVMVYKDGASVASTTVDRLGQFSVSGLGSGRHDVIVVGSSYAALGVELVAMEEELPGVAAKAAGKRLVSSNLQASDSLLIPVIANDSGDGQGNGMSAEEDAEGALPPGMLAGGAFGPGYGGFGGGAGGGGGFGGGGGIGAAGGLAAIAIGAAALADDDDGFNQNASTGLVP